MEKLWAQQDQILDNQQLMLKKLNLLVEQMMCMLQTDDIKDDLHLDISAGDADWQECLVRAAIQDCKEWVHSNTNLPNMELSHSKELLHGGSGMQKRYARPQSTLFTAIFLLIDQEVCFSSLFQMLLH